MNPQMILERMDAVRAATLRRFETLSQAELDWQPPRQDGKPEWSPGEIFMHIAIDEDYLREHLARPLLEGVMPPPDLTIFPPLPNYGLSKAVIAYWFERARLMTRRMVENENANWNLEPRHSGGFDETANGAEWLLGYAEHEEFHHKQIDALLERVRTAK